MFSSFSFVAMIVKNNPMDMGMGGWREQVMGTSSIEA